MPLPDAEKDRRLYELLKTQDLENLSYADFQAAAESVFVEDVNEDDLRRIVLIQLARMSVAGEWNGLLNAGGGGGGAPTDAEYVTLATDATLTNERVLTAGAGVSLTDAGAGSTATIANTGVTSNVAGTGITVTGATGTSQIAVSSIITDLLLAEYVTLATDTGLQNERVLTAGTGISITDAGAGSTVTIAATGGGGGTNNVIDSLVTETPSTFTVPILENLTNQGGTGYGNQQIPMATFSDTSGSFLYYRSFNASKTGTLSSIIHQAVNSTAGASIKVAIYNSDSDGNPQTLIGQASCAMTAFSVSIQTTITPESTGSMDLTKGDLYWIGIGNDGGGSGATPTGYLSLETKAMGNVVSTDSVGTGTFAGFTCLIGAFTPPTTFVLLSTGQKQAIALGGLYS